jgi:L-alanine-DL-glutamate epimerase-like enolase superfamily enzyme
MTSQSKLSSFEIIVCDAGWRDWFYLIFKSSCGQIGISEFTESHGPKIGLIASIHEMSEIIVGQNCHDVEQIIKSLQRRNKQSLGGTTWKTISAIENALWDLRSKVESTPIRNLMGISKSNLDITFPVYWSHCGTTRVRAAHLVNENPITKLADLWALGNEIENDGFKAFKTNILDFSNSPQVLMPGFSYDCETPKLVNASGAVTVKNLLGAITHHGELQAQPIIDWNYNVEPENYKDLLEIVSKYNSRWVEIDFNSSVDLDFLPNQSDVTICTGENLLGIDAYEPYLISNKIGVISIDLLWNGLSESLKIANRAIELGKKVTIHNYYSHFATSMALTFLECLPPTELLEYDKDDVPWRDAIVTQVITPNKGEVVKPPGIGWGNNLKLEEIAGISTPRTEKYRSLIHSLKLL